MDMAMDNSRQRIYIANSGMNRVEILDMRTRTLLNPIKVGQLPHSMALATDGSTLYVANSGGENISIVDLDKGQTVGRVSFPPVPLNAATAIVTPSVIASSQHGPQIIMSDGSLWKISGNTAVPRTLNTAVFGTARTLAGPVRTMVSTPGGEFVLALAGNGTAYLYDAQADDFVLSKAVVTPPIQGFYGPVAAGPRGSYYLVNGLVLNQSLTLINTVPTLGTVGPITGPVFGFPARPGTTATPTSRPVAAVSAVTGNMFARFSTPTRSSANQALTDAGTIELVEPTSGRTMAVVNALETPLAAATGTQRVNINGRTMVVDPTGSTIYAVTATGLSIIPIPSRDSLENRPNVNPNGAVSTASYLPVTAPGGLISVFGKGLASTGAASGGPLPTTLGNTCVTLNNQALPLVMTSDSQVNAQVPPSLAAGRFPLVVRAIDRQMASVPTTVTVNKYAPAVFLLNSGDPAIFHQDGTPVNQDNPANRDESLFMYAAGLGATTGGKVVAGQPSPSNPPAVTGPVQVFFGNPGYKQAGIIVDWSGLVPGMIGIYQVNLRVPGDHLRGGALPVTVRIGGISSPTSGPAAPFVAVN
jgi:uncharacterized protein (TIGR03437 family)